jgi:hypothetical protein
MQEKANEILALNARVRKAWSEYHARLTEIWKMFEDLHDVVRMVTVGKLMQNFRAPLLEVDELIKKSGIAVTDEPPLIAGTPTGVLDDESDEQEFDDSDR